MDKLRLIYVLCSDKESFFYLNKREIYSVIREYYILDYHFNGIKGSI